MGRTTLVWWSWLATALLVPGVARGEPPLGAAPGRAQVQGLLSESERGDLAFLLHLGWQLEEDPGATDVRVVPGRPCTREGLAQARAAGDLRVIVPSPPSPANARRVATLLPGLVDSVASRCAWQLRVHEAVRRATQRLSANTERGRFVFPPFLVLFDSPFWELEPPEPEWVRQGEVFVAATTPSKAIEAFYEKEAQAECYAAQILSTYAIQRELYGDAAFDRVFRPEELALGPPKGYLKTPIGAHAVYERTYPWRALLIPTEDQAKDYAMVLAGHGPKAFSGVTGIVKDQQGGDLSNENFTIVSVSPAANEALRTGGFGQVAVLASKALEATRAAQAYLAQAPAIREARRQVEEILREPVLSEVMVYTHPYGVVPLGYLVRAKLKRKLAAVEAWLYANGREDFFYRRYRESFAKGLLPAEPSAPPR